MGEAAGRRVFAIFLFMLLAAGRSELSAQVNGSHAAATVRAVRATAPIDIDGRLIDEGWAAVQPFTEFRQRDPDEGQPASEGTRLKVLYDDRSLYIGAELADRDAARIVSRLSRRDDPPDSDYFQLYLDPYHDHLSGVMFQVSAAGAQADFILSNDTGVDGLWDAVWDAAVLRTDTGWFVEMRIPFSQLRFAGTDSVWGINASRFIHRRNEMSWVELVPRREYGLASRMAHLIGLEGIVPRHNLEVLPYARSSIELAPSVTGDPFHDGSRAFAGAGLDLKFGISSNLVLDATMNPDFGQVEVDPAVVNLSAFESFFDERRPFFLEGSAIFGNFGRAGTGGGGSVAFPTYVYSRRIGRPPRGASPGLFEDRPAASTILGAVKLTGKPASLWSLGVLNAVTSPEHATVISESGRGRVQIEPLTNHFIARVLREIPGRAGFGMLLTSVQRRIDQPLLDAAMPRHAEMLGGDAYYFLDEARAWSVNARMSGSVVAGSPAAIERLQRSTHHYFQRPDAPHVELDPTATSMKGSSGGVILKKNTGSWLFETSFSGSSAGFDVDESGFQGGNDFWGPTGRLTWRQLSADRFSWNRSLWIDRSDAWTFGNERNPNRTQIGGDITLPNYWTAAGNVTLRGRSLDDRLTRGGPLAAGPSSRSVFLRANSDSRKSINVGINGSYNRDEYGGWNVSGGGSMGLKPLSSLTITLEPNVDRSLTFAQYVTTIDDGAAGSTFGRRYIFADLDQSSVGLTSRINMGLTPRMSLQVYSQVLLSAGDYWRLKELERPRTLSFRAYGEHIGSIALAEHEYVIDPDGPGPSEPFVVSDPDFNFKSFRLNALFRWEWKPGSTLFLVWTQSREDSLYPGSLSTGRDFGALFRSPAQNVVLVKATYWFNR